LIYCNNNFLNAPGAFPLNAPSASLNILTVNVLFTPLIGWVRSDGDQAARWGAAGGKAGFRVSLMDGLIPQGFSCNVVTE
jgi:hypothetical protein